jgi:hypothetical protein
MVLPLVGWRLATSTPVLARGHKWRRVGITDSSPFAADCHPFVVSNSAVRPHGSAEQLQGPTGHDVGSLVDDPVGCAVDDLDGEVVDVILIAAEELSANNLVVGADQQTGPGGEPGSGGSRRRCSAPPAG